MGSTLPRFTRGELSHIMPASHLEQHYDVLHYITRNYLPHCK